MGEVTPLFTFKPATSEELLASWQEDSEDFELVHEEEGPDDHGYTYTFVFKRLSDDTYWETYGVCQSGGDYHTLRDGDAAAPDQVYPHQVTVTTYTRDPHG